MSGAFECCAGLHSLSPLSLLAPSSGSVICFGQILIPAARSFYHVHDQQARLPFHQMIQGRVVQWLKHSRPATQATTPVAT